MYERFTDRARQVMIDAQLEAARHSHNYLGTEHLLFGLTQGDGIAAKALRQLGIEPETIRAAIVDEIGAGPGSPVHIPFTPRAKQSMEAALRQALAWGHNYIGTEHLLAGLAGDDGSLAFKILDARGVSAVAVRTTVLQLLGAHVAANPMAATTTAPVVDEADITAAIAGPECPSCGVSLADNLAADVIPSVGPIDRVFVVAYCSGCGHTLTVLPDD